MGSAMKPPIRVGPHAGDQRLEFGDQIIGELRHALVRRAAVDIWARQVPDSVTLVAELVHPVARPLAHRLRQIGGPVIGIVPRHDPGLGGVAADMVIKRHHAQGRIHRGRSAGCEMHPVQISRGQFGQFARQNGRHVRCHIDEIIGIGQSFGLIANGLRHFLAAKANIGAPHPTNRIQVFAPLGIPQMHPFPARDDQRPLVFKRSEIGPGVQRMGTVQFPGVKVGEGRGHIESPVNSLPRG